MIRDDELPALTLRQPWAWAVIYGGKDIENRDKRTSITGRFVVHAASVCDPVSDYKAAAHWMVARGLVRSETWRDLVPASADAEVLARWAKAPILPDIEDLPRGVLIGTADLVGTVDRAEDVGGWKMPGLYGYRLANPKPCVEKHYKGMPGWFYVPAKLVKERPAPAFTTSLPDRIQHARAAICAKCKKPVDSVFLSHSSASGSLSVAVRAYCHGKIFEKTFTGEEIMKLQADGIVTFEVFT